MFCVLGEQRNIGLGSQDLCTIYEARCELLQVNLNINDKETQLFACFEIVGDRFLRNMVRILLSTTIRESLLSEANRNEDILFELCLAGKR